MKRTGSNPDNFMLLHLRKTLSFSLSRSGNETGGLSFSGIFVSDGQVWTVETKVEYNPGHSFKGEPKLVLDDCEPTYSESKIGSRSPKRQVLFCTVSRSFPRIKCRSDRKTR